MAPHGDLSPDAALIEGLARTDQARGISAVDQRAVFYDVDWRLERAHLLQRVVAHRHHVPDVAGPQPTEPLLLTQQPRRAERRRLDRLQRRHPRFDIKRQLSRVYAVRLHAGIGAVGDGDAGANGAAQAVHLVLVDLTRLGD